MIVYIILIVLCLLFDFMYQHKMIDDKKQKILFWGLCVLFTLVSALRYNVGTDYKGTYTNAYRWLSNGNFYDFEFLFLALNKLFIYLNLSVVHLMSFCSIFTVPAFFVFIRKNVDKKYQFLSAFLLLGTTVYYASLNVVRQYMAIAVFLYSFKFFKEKKYFSYILCLVIASLFHQSILFSIVLFAFYFLFKYSLKRRSNTLIWVFYIISLLGIIVDFRDVFNLMSMLIPDRYTGYLNSVFINEKNMLAFFKIIIPNALLFISMKNKKKFMEDNVKCYSLYALFIYVFLTNMFFGINVFIRLTLFVDLFMVLLIPYLLATSKEKNENSSEISRKKYPNKLKYILIAYYIVLNIYSIFIMGGHGVVPYSTFLNI